MNSYPGQISYARSLEIAEAEDDGERTKKELSEKDDGLIVDCGCFQRRFGRCEGRHRRSEGKHRRHDGRYPRFARQHDYD